MKPWRGFTCVGLVLGRVVGNSVGAVLGSDVGSRVGLCTKDSTMTGASTSELGGSRGRLGPSNGQNFNQVWIQNRGIVELLLLLYISSRYLFLAAGRGSEPRSLGDVWNGQIGR